MVFGHAPVPILPSAYEFCVRQLSNTSFVATFDEQQLCHDRNAT